MLRTARANKDIPQQHIITYYMHKSKVAFMSQKDLEP